MTGGSAVKRRRLLVSGLVQGVWFRSSCRDVALGLGVEGSARNLADGRVEVILQGPAEAVAHVERWCHSGPPRARVIAVSGEDEPPTGLRGFVIS